MLKSLERENLVIHELVMFANQPSHQFLILSSSAPLTHDSSSQAQISKGSNSKTKIGEVVNC